MKQYLNLMNKIINEGDQKEVRNGKTLNLFNQNFEHDLTDGFPLLTTKKMNWNAILHEFLWIVSGESHIRNLKKHTGIWNEFADENGEIDSPYGYFLRYFPNPNGKPFDQLQWAIDMLKTNPNRRRIVMTSWFPTNAINADVPPCHFAYVFNYSGGRLNLHVTQRSADMAIGFPFDLAVWSLMLLTVCILTELAPGKIAFSIIDAHIYEEHLEAVEKQLFRMPYNLPWLNIENHVDINFYDADDYQLMNYQHHDRIKFTLKP